MGPKDMFNGQLLQDELEKHADLVLWGVIYSRRQDDIDVPHFFNMLGLSDEAIQEVHVGVLDQENLPVDMIRPANWTVPSFLNFLNGAKAPGTT